SMSSQSLLSILYSLPSPTRIPYTTLFRSKVPRPHAEGGPEVEVDQRVGPIGHAHADVDQPEQDVLGRKEPPDAHPSAGNPGAAEDRKSTRLNSSHVKNSYAVFC